MAAIYDRPEESENYCPLDEKLGDRPTFHFPDRCCRCMAPSPTKEWQVRNGKRVEDTNVHVTFHIAVPVCSDCWSTLRRTQLQVTAVTLFLALLAAIALWYYDPFDSRNAEPKNVFMIWSVTAIFLAPLFLGVHFAIGAIFVPRHLRSVAYLNRDGNQLTFYNREYQRLFLTCYPTSDTPDDWYAEAPDEPAQW